MMFTVMVVSILHYIFVYYIFEYIYAPAYLEGNEEEKHPQPQQHQRLPPAVCQRRSLQRQRLQLIVLQYVLQSLPRTATTTDGYLLGSRECQFKLESAP